MYTKIYIKEGIMQYIVLKIFIICFDMMFKVFNTSVLWFLERIGNTNGFQFVLNIKHEGTFLDLLNFGLY